MRKCRRRGDATVGWDAERRRTPLPSKSLALFRLSIPSATSSLASALRHPLIFKAARNKRTMNHRARDGIRRLCSTHESCIGVERFLWKRNRTMVEPSTHTRQSVATGIIRRPYARRNKTRSTYGCRSEKCGDV